MKDGQAESGGAAHGTLRLKKNNKNCTAKEVFQIKKASCNDSLQEREEGQMLTGLAIEYKISYTKLYYENSNIYP